MTIPIVSWKDRENVTNAREAVAALADFVSSTHGISLLMASGNATHQRNALLEVKAFADKWAIPFSLSMLRETMTMMSRKRFHGETNDAQPRRADFSDSESYRIAWTRWDESRGDHIWVSSTERYRC